MSFLNVLINLLRSIPFIILMVMVIPLTRVIVGTSVGTVASICAADGGGVPVHRAAGGKTVCVR